jgi:nucleotide-binding universal stress UspA family protein
MSSRFATETRELKGGRVADAIVAQARASKCDLIVIGTHGRRGFSRALMGSDAERVVRESSVPVLVVRASEAAD